MGQDVSGKECAHGTKEKQGPGLRSRRPRLRTDQEPAPPQQGPHRTFYPSPHSLSESGSPCNSEGQRAWLHLCSQQHVSGPTGHYKPRPGYRERHGGQCPPAERVGGRARCLPMGTTPPCPVVSPAQEMWEEGPSELTVKDCHLVLPGCPLLLPRDQQ